MGAARLWLGVGVATRDRQIAMAQSRLDQRDRRTPIQRVAGVGMPQPMRTDWLLDVGAPCSLEHDIVDLGGLEVFPAILLAALAGHKHRLIVSSLTAQTLEFARISGVSRMGRVLPPLPKATICPVSVPSASSRSCT